MYGQDVTVCPNDGARLDDNAKPADPLIGSILAERYRIIRTLGEGGMGRVYLGEHVRMGRMSAIKVLHPALAPTADAIGRFNREAANASRINDPHVAAIYDFGETADGTLYLAMEYVEGETLAQLLARVGPLAPRRAAALTIQIANALQAAHKLGIVHRDLKPDNILVTASGGTEDFAKVVDFGIAKSMRTTGQTVTIAGISIGTPEFMSPEQLAGGELDHRSDIYALGLVVYAMLTGRLPYPEPSSKDALVERLTARPRSLSEVSPARQWPASLQAALDRALSPDSSARYEVVTDFARDIEAAVASDTGPAATTKLTPLVTRRIEAPTVRTTVPMSAPPARSRKTAWLVLGSLVAVAAIALASRGFARGSGLPAVRDTVVTVSETLPSVVAAGAPATVPVPHDTPAAPASVVPGAAKVKADTSAARAARATSIIASGLPAASLAAPAATAVPVPADTDISRPVVPADTSKRAGRHAWLRVSGDSSPKPLPGASRMQTESREVIGHLNRAKGFFVSREPGRAFPEIRTAYEEWGMFAADHPNTPETRQMGNQFRNALSQVVNTCRVVNDSAVAVGHRSFNCESIERAARNGMKTGQSGDTSGGVQRRPQRPVVSPPTNPL